MRAKALYCKGLSVSFLVEDFNGDNDHGIMVRQSQLNLVEIVWQE